MKFVREVQAKKIAPPTSKDFLVEVWVKCFKELVEDEEDRRLFEAGEWLHQQLSAVREKQTFVVRSDIDTAIKLKAVVGFVNIAAMEMIDNFKNNILEAFEGRDSIVDDELIQLKITLDNGANLSTDEVAESIGSGAEKVFQYIFRSGDGKGVAASESRKFLFSEVMRDVNLGVLYKALEAIWERCLWEGYEIKTGESVHVRPTNQDNLDWFVVTNCRQDRLNRNLFNTAIEQLENGFLEKNPVRQVVAIKREGRHQRLLLGFTEKASWIRGIEAAMRVVVRRQYYEDLWHVSSKKRSGLTLDLVLSGWKVIASACDLLWHELRERRPSDVSVNDNAPILQVPALVNALKKALSIDQNVALNLLDFFAYKGLRGQDLWAQPLIFLSKDRIAPILLARFSEVKRLIDIWLVQLGFSLDKRGNVFERHVREVSVDSAKNSRNLKEAQVLAYQLKFGNPLIEQIDLIIVFGGIVIVGESKCHVLPYEPREWYRHRDYVNKAVAQIRRKCKAVEKNRSLFIEQLKSHGIIVPEVFEIQPLVVMNSALHAGVVVDEIPVIDLPMLETYFAGYVNNASIEVDGIYKTIERLCLHSSAADAERKLNEYLNYPPQLTRLWKSLRSSSIPISMPSTEGGILAVLHSREIEIN